VAGAEQAATNCNSSARGRWSCTTTRAAEPVRISIRAPMFPTLKNFGEYRLTYRTGDIVSPKIDPAEPLALEIQDFCSAVRSGAVPRSSMTVGLDVVRVLEAVDRSLDGGGVPLRSPTSPRLRRSPKDLSPRSEGGQRRRALLGKAPGHRRGRATKGTRKHRRRSPQPCSASSQYSARPTKHSQAVSPRRSVATSKRARRCVSAGVATGGASAVASWTITTSSTVNYLSPEPLLAAVSVGETDRFHGTPGVGALQGFWPRPCCPGGPR